ncbi:hypothetical protein J3R83DRAFT_3389 [Lanmaoa asiatica]|nr:hypothetical protein J3R83DRAFT_3389 [Lanmaoa asiatica]
MAPVCQKYKWAEKTLTATVQCQFCENTFKPQGIKSHELHCSRHKEKEKQHIQSGKEYERDLIQAEAQVVSLVMYVYSGKEAGPSRPVDMNSQFPVSWTVNSTTGSSPELLSEHDDFIDQDMRDSSEQGRPGSEQPLDFKTEFHPHSHRLPLYQQQKSFGLWDAPEMAPNSQPWSSFVKEGDYLFAEVALRAGLNASQVNSLLTLISHISQGKAKVMLQNGVDL